jgi:hypothetical protein
MPFYVKLGPRGAIFRIGTFLIGIIGSAVYWRASRRRGRIPHRHQHVTSVINLPHNG